jgi:hypothetical protein
MEGRILKRPNVVIPQDHVKKATRAICAAMSTLGRVDGVADKKALVGLKEAKGKFDELYRQGVGRKAAAVAQDASPAENV